MLSWQKQIPWACVLFETKTDKTALCQRQGLRPFAICGLRACERRCLSPPSPRKCQILLRRILALTQRKPLKPAIPPIVTGRYRSASGLSVSPDPSGVSAYPLLPHDAEVSVSSTKCQCTIPPNYRLWFRMFLRFSLLWCKPEERRRFLLRDRHAEACFGAGRHRRRNIGRSPCITARVFLVFVKGASFFP